MVESEKVSYIRTFGAQCMYHISKVRNPNLGLLVEKPVLLLALTGIIEVKLSLNRWRFCVSVLPYAVPSLFSTRQKGRILHLPSWPGEREFVPHSLWNTFGISSFWRSKILRQLPKSGGCLFICFLVSELIGLTQSLMVLLKLWDKGTYPVTWIHDRIKCKVSQVLSKKNRRSPRVLLDFA